VREKRENTASSVGVAPLTIGGTLSKAPQLPTPTLQHSRYAKRDDGVSSQRDMREKRNKHSFERRSRAAKQNAIGNC
jgi:hypothetical protein